MPTPSDQKISERLAPVLTAAADRIHYAESRRSNYSSMAVGFIAAGVAIFTFGFGALEMLWLRWMALAAGAGLVGSGVLVLVVYGLQTNNYPFTSATKSWKWFYRNALSDEKAFDVPWHACFRWGSTKERVQNEYERQLPAFKAIIASLHDDKVNAQQDVDQLYTLHVNEKYKNLYLKQIRSVFNFGLLFVALVSALGAGYGTHLDRKSYEPVTSVVETSMGSQSAVWTPLTPPLATEWQGAAKLVVTNKSTTTQTLSGFVASQEDGYELPVEITPVRPELAVVGPGQTVTIYLHLKSNRAVASRMTNLQARFS